MPGASVWWIPNAGCTDALEMSDVILCFHQVMVVPAERLSEGSVANVFPWFWHSRVLGGIFCPPSCIIHHLIIIK